MKKSSGTDAQRHHLDNLRTLRLVMERLAAERVRRLLALAPTDAAQRVLTSISHEDMQLVLELEDVLDRWEARLSGRPLQVESALTFDEVIESLREVKLDAAELYRNAAGACPDAELARRLRRLASREEEQAEVLDLLTSPTA